MLSWVVDWFPWLIAGAFALLACGLILLEILTSPHDANHYVDRHWRD